MSPTSSAESTESEPTAGERFGADRKVLIANRGEIAVRVADEAYALGGTALSRGTTPGPPAEKKVGRGRRSGHRAARESGADAEFAQAVLDAGLIRIGPPPRAIRDLGDEVAARYIAQRAGAPLVAGTPDPVSGAEEVVAFAEQPGLPITVKAAFGHGECFVERYLDRPRHVETQRLADRHGNVVVVSTRDCSLRRRHQKPVEEAPAPFPTDARDEQPYAASKAIPREVGHVGAGTCEFLIGQDGAISFMEVNTRLQVEHPVTETVEGIDLAREQPRIAAGEEPGYDDPPLGGHSFEFRVNGEDPGRDFLPAPGTVTRWDPPTGPGVRPEAGVEAGRVIGPAWDALPAKLIVTGRARRIRRRPGGRGAGSAVSGDTLTSPVQGVIVKVAVEEGAALTADAAICAIRE